MLLSRKKAKEHYEIIYDKVCKYLDIEFYEKNVCDFQDDKCGEKRNTSSLVGCCRPYKNILRSTVAF